MRFRFFFCGVLCLYGFGYNAKAQELTGNYYGEGGIYAKFKDGKNIEFRLTQFGGLVNDVAGAGTYKVKGQKIDVLFTYGYMGGSHSSCTITAQNEGDDLKFFVKYPTSDITRYAHFVYKLKNKIVSVISDRNGFALIKLTEMPDDSLITMSMFGFDECRVKLTALRGIVYEIQSVPGNLIYRDADTKRGVINYRLSGDTLWAGYYSGKLKKLIKDNY